MTKIRYSLTDEAIAGELGRRLARLRLNANISQDQLADSIGIDRGRIGRLEHSGTGKLSTLIAVLRHLDKLELLEEFLPETDIVSPLEVAESQLKSSKGVRQRARTAPTGKRKSKESKEDLGW